jgi:hypothetical protein
MLSPALLAVTLVLIVLAAIPTRRLGAAGFRAGALLTYLAVLVALGLVIHAGALPARFVVPVLAVLYVAPLVMPPDLLGRLLRRGNGGAGRAAGGSAVPRPVGSGPGRTVGPDGLVEPDPPETRRP